MLRCCSKKNFLEFWSSLDDLEVIVIRIFILFVLKYVWKTFFEFFSTWFQPCILLQIGKKNWRRYAKKNKDNSNRLMINIENGWVVGRILYGAISEASVMMQETERWYFNWGH